MDATHITVLALLYIVSGLLIAFGHYYFQPSKDAPQRKRLGKLASYSYGTACIAGPYAVYLVYVQQYMLAIVYAGFVLVAGSVTIATNLLDRRAAEEKSNHDAELEQQIYLALRQSDMDGD